MLLTIAQIKSRGGLPSRSRLEETRLRLRLSQALAPLPREAQPGWPRGPERLLPLLLLLNSGKALRTFPFES